jgi:hypothetical protein
MKSCIIKQSKPQNTNTSKAEREALCTLRENKDMLILPADKGNATVVMNSKDYMRKMEVLSNQTYQLLSTDLTKVVERKMTRLIRSQELQKKWQKR